MVSFVHTLLALPILAFFIFMKYKTNSSTTLLKGPKGLPIIGNLHQLDTSNLHFQLWNISKIYGPLFSLKFGFKQAIVVSSPKLAKEILKDHDLDVCNRPISYGIQRLSYNGLDIGFSQYNESWRQRKKNFVHHLLSSKKLSSYSHVRKYEVKQMIEKISKHVDSSKVCNLSEIIMSVISTIVCKIAFGRSYDHEGDEKSRFQGLFNEVQTIFISFFVANFIPFMGWIDKLRGLVARVDKTFKALDELFEQVLEEHLDANNRKEEEEEKDIIDVLLELMKEGCLSIDFTNDHIKALIMNFFLAAIDTSAATTIWVMTALMKNPIAMKKAQEEVRYLYDQKEFIDEHDIQKLVYLKAVVKETLRYYPPVPLVPRETINSFILNGQKIEPKTLVYINVWAIHRDSETWNDAEEFYPERFLTKDIDFKGQSFELIPFGAGHRMCPGISLGMAMVEIITANLLYSFDWEMPEGMTNEDIDIERLPGFTSQKKNHLCLVAKKTQVNHHNQL